jgi:site-specific DNA recombinase
VNTSDAPRACLYARISEDTTGEARGVARQLEACRELATSRGWHIVAEVTDNDVSALRGAYRSGYEEVLRLVRDGHLDYVVCWQTSRLLRNRRERADAIELFGRQRVGIIAVKGISFDLTTAYGRGQAGLMGEFDTMESEVKAERVAASAIQRAQAGRPSADLGYGWIVEGTGSSATFREDPHQAGVVREIVNRLLSGETLRSITQSLNDRGEPAPKTATWGKTSVKKITMRESNISVRVHHRGQPDETRYQGVWPSLVDPVKHRKVVALLTEPNRRKNAGQATNPVRPGARRHLLSWGVAECGVCGGHLSLHTRATARYGKPVTYYRCDEKGCVGRNAAGLDQFVRDVVIERLSRPDALAWLMGDEKEAGMLTDRIMELSDLLKEAADDYAAKRITRPVFLRLCENYQTDLDAAEEELRRVNMALDVDVLRPLAGPEAAARWDAMMVSQRRAILETLRMRVIVDRSTRRGPGFDPASVRIEWRDPHP